MKTQTTTLLVRHILPGIGAGILLALSFPPCSLPFLLPFGMALLLLALREADIRIAAYTGFGCGLAYFGGTLFWLGNLFGVAAVSLVAIASIFPMLFAVIFTVLRRLRVPGWLLAAMVWTACEYFRSEPFILNFGWVGLGYGVINSAAWATVASVIGSYGISFLIVVFASLIVPDKNRRWLSPLAIAVWTLTLLVPSPTLSPHNPLNVRLVQAFSDDTDTLFKLSAPANGTTTDILVWPEYSINSDPRRDKKLWGRLQQLAITGRTYFLFGAKDIPDPQNDDVFRNTAFLLDPTGNPVARHVKNHTVHFIKDGVRGTEAKAAITRLGKLGIAICFDMDYPDVARRLAADGAEVFLVPNMDPAEWGGVQRGQHKLMFQMRAAECGRWLARADVAGGTSVCAPSGRVGEAVTTDEPTALTVTVGRSSTQTFYVLGGWRFGQFCLLCCCGLMIIGARGRRFSLQRPGPGR